MPLALAIVAMLVFVIAVRGNYEEAGKLANQTFFGTGETTGFITWFFSILALATIFRIIRAPQAGELFIGLVLLVYFLKNNDVLSKIEQAIQQQGATQ